MIEDRNFLKTSDLARLIDKFAPDALRTQSNGGKGANTNLMIIFFISYFLLNI